MKRKFTVPGVGTFDLTDEQLLRIVDHQRAVEDTTSLSMRVLFRCCEQRVYTSSVLLAIDESDTSGVDISPEVVQWALEELNQKDWVVYSLGDHGVYTNIRPTKHGYTAAGYPPPQPIIGPKRWSYANDSPLHPGDATDFRTLSAYTWGGPIERESLSEHLIHYPDHISIHNIDEVNEMAAIAPDLQKVMDENGVSLRTAYKILRKQEADKYGNDVKPNHKIVALEALNQLPDRGVDMATLRTKMADLGLVADAHTLTHIVWALQKEQLVKFRERKNSGKGTESVLHGIRLLPRGVARIQQNRSRGLSKIDVPLRSARPARRDFPKGPSHPKYLKEIGYKPDPIIDDGYVGAQPTESPAEATTSLAQVMETPAEVTTEDTHTEYPEHTEYPDFQKTEDAAVWERGRLPEPEMSVTKIAFGMDDFPLITALMSRGEKVEKAAELLMEAGQEELAMQALNSVKYSPLEEELLRFIKTLG